jgi:plasmid stabilization system protein ParE
MVERILAAIETLKLAPNRTIYKQKSRKLDRPVRSLAVSSYIVYFYMIDDERIVRILTIRHGARRKPSRFEA